MPTKRQTEARWIENANRWQVNVTSADGNRKTFVSSKPGKKGKLEAERKADDWLEDGCMGSGTRVSVAFDAFIEHIKGQGTSPTYWEPYVSIGRTWIKPNIGTRRMSAITETQLESILQKANEKGLAEKSIKNIRSCIMAFLKYARKSNMTTLHPEELRMPKGSKESEKFTLTEQEIQVLLSSSKTCYRGKEIDEWYIHAFRFSVLMGYRPGEIAGMQNRDIKGDIIKIVRGISDKGKETSLKNKNAKRTKMLNELAKRELAAQKEMLMSAGIVSPWVFPGKDGNAIEHNTYRKSLRRYLEHNNIGKRILNDGSMRYITPYELRHTWVSANDEMPDGLKKRAAGWSKTFAGDSYNHPMQQDAERIAAYENERFSQLIGSPKK